VDACASSPAEPLLRAPSIAPDPASGDGIGTSPGPSATGVPAGTPPPVIGHSVVATGTGTIKVRRPGSARFRTLGAAARIPVGSVVDARAGRATLVSALVSSGRVQSGTFWGSLFEVRQPKGGRGRVELYLRGGGLSACRRTATAAATAAGSARAAAVRKRPRRSLWGRDHHGRYRTHGSNSAATARGTRWQTVDTCAGTLTRVLSGSVSVRDRVRHRTVIVRAGHHYRAKRR
jgi:hypothetical protein